MSTRALQVILFPEDELAPRLVPLEFNLEEREDRPGVFPCSQAKGQVELVLANGRVDLPSILDIDHHIIVPRLANIDSNQMYLMYSEAGGRNHVNLSLAHLTDGRARQGWTRNFVVFKSSPVHDIWQDADLEADLQILKRYLSWLDN